jgi:hypothetical protein
MITAGERLSYDGTVYQLPLPDGQGKAIRSRAETAPIPISIRFTRLSCERSDGLEWLIVHVSFRPLATA